MILRDVLLQTVHAGITNDLASIMHNLLSNQVICKNNERMVFIDESILY